MMNPINATWLLGLGLALLSSSALSAYTPPIGIPAPTFGIDETAPAQPAAWPSSEASGFYYIDNSHPQATDSNNTYGYPNKPRLTLPNTAFPAGTYVEVHGGPYTGFPILTFTCTKQNPCWFRGTPASIPTITGSVTIRDSQYLIVEHLDFNGGNGGAVTVSATNGKNSNHISVRNSKVRNRNFVGATAGMSTYPQSGGITEHVVFYNNELTKLGLDADWDCSGCDPDFHAIDTDVYGRDSTVGTQNRYVWILNNSCSFVSGNCVQLTGQACTGSCADMLHHVYIGFNVAHSNRQGGFWSKEARDVIMSQNVSYNNRAHANQPGDGMGYQYGPDNVWIIFNHIYDSNYGIRQSDTGSAPDRKIYIIGNVIHNIHPQSGATYSPTDGWRQGIGISLWHGNQQRFIVDNTIYDVHGGINSIYDGPLTISGNIITNIYDQDCHVCVSQAAKSGNASISSGLFYDPELGTPKIYWNSTTYTDLSQLKTAAGQCNSCTAGNPEFVDTTNNNFDLLKTSAAINKNDANAVYDVFMTRYGIDIKKDFKGRTRALGLKPDFGAFEVGVAPTAPNNFLVK